MIKLSKKVLIGAAAASLLTSGTAFAWNFTPVTKTIQARFAHIKLVVNGRYIQTSAEPFIYNGNVYAPVATIANALGVHQQWNNKTPEVEIRDPKVGSFYQPWTGHLDQLTDAIIPLDYYNGFRNIGDENHPKFEIVNEDPKFKPIPIPQMPHDDDNILYYRQEILSNRLINFNAEKADSFVMGETFLDKKTGVWQYWVTAYRYHPEQHYFYKTFSQRLDEGEPYMKQVSFDLSRHMFTVKLIGKDGKTVGVKWFANYAGSKYQKVDEVMKEDQAAA